MSVYFIDTITSAQAAAFNAATDSLVLAGANDTASTVSVQFIAASATSTESITVTSGSGRSVAFGVGLSGAQPVLADGSLLFVGRSTNEALTGGAGGDGLWGGGGSDTLDGGNGDDVLVGGLGADHLTGGAGADRFVFYRGDSGPLPSSLDTIDDWSASDHLAFQVSGANGGYLELIGDSFAAALWAANQKIAAGVDYVAAQVGSDVVVFADTAGDNSGAADGIVLAGRTLADISARNIFSGGGPISPAPPTTTPPLPLGGGDGRTGSQGPDILVGSNGTDVFDGFAGNDSLGGGDGDDYLMGSAGDDTISGDRGGDTVLGGSGNDLFLFGVGDSGTTEGELDVVADFASGDRLMFAGGRLTPTIANIPGADDFEAAQALANIRIGAGEANFVLAYGPVVSYLFVDSRNDDGRADDVVVLLNSGPLTREALVAGPAPPDDPQIPGPSIRGDAFQDARALVSGDMDQAHLSHALNAVITGASDTAVEAGVGDVSLTLYGSGFSTDANGKLSGGAFTSLNYSYGLSEGSAFSMQYVGHQPTSFLTLNNFLASDATQAAWATLLPGSDRIVGTTQSDLLRGYGGDDQISGSGGADTVWGGLGNDYIYALEPGAIPTSAAATFLRGEEGDDYIIGGAGFDNINGNVGSDTISGGDGDDWAVGGKDNDLLFGGAGADLVYGNVGNDTCSGGDGSDIVRGGQDNDQCFGGAGDDFVSGDKGSDTITGGAGADIFHTFGDAGLDQVTDFNSAQGDRVQVDPGTQFTVSQVGTNVVIDMVGGGQMILIGVTLSTLHAGWIFGA